MPMLKIVCCVDTLLVCLYMLVLKLMCVSQHPLFGMFYNTDSEQCVARHLLSVFKRDCGVLL